MHVAEGFDRLGSDRYVSVVLHRLRCPAPCTFPLSYKWPRSPPPHGTWGGRGGYFYIAEAFGRCLHASADSQKVGECCVLSIFYLADPDGTVWRFESRRAPRVRPKRVTLTLTLTFTALGSGRRTVLH